MAQVRYATEGAGTRKADSIASINVERDVIVIPNSQTHMIAATEPTVLVVEVKPGSWVVLLSGGTGTWTEQ